MIATGTNIACDNSVQTIDTILLTNFLTHVIVRPLGSDHIPKKVQYRHILPGFDPLQTSAGTSITVHAVGPPARNYTLVCSNGHRLYIEHPYEHWLRVDEVQVGLPVFIFDSPKATTNGPGTVTVVSSVASFTGYDLFLENELQQELAIYAAGMLVRLPH